MTVPASPLSSVFGGAALFGLTIGSYRGGPQMLWSAVKMPFVLLVPVVVCVPAIRQLHGSKGAVSAIRAGAAALVGVARIAVLATALVPLLWLLFSLPISYRSALLLMVSGLVLVGVPGLAVVARALAPTRPDPVAMAATIAVVGIVLAQTGWVLRPMLSPRTSPIVAICPVSEDVFSGLLDAVVGSLNPELPYSPLDCTVQGERVR